MGFNFAKVNFTKSAEVPFVFDLKLPDGVDSGAKLHVIGDMSSTVKNFSKAAYQRWQQKQATAKRKGKEPEDMSLAEAEDMAIESALIRLVGWEGILDEADKPLKFTKEAGEAFLREVDYARQQIMDQASDVTNFRPK